MIRALYNWTLSQAEHPKAKWIMGAVSFVESSFFPIPPDILLIPMVIAERSKAFLLAAIATITSVLGGFLGYAIGALLFVQIAQPVLEFYGYMYKIDIFKDYFNEYGAWAVFIAGVTPFPYKVITITSGISGLDILTFGIASILSRGLRFFLVCTILYYFGPSVRRLIEKYLGLAFTLFVILLIGGFVLIKGLV